MAFPLQRLPVSWLSVCIAFAGALYCGFQAASGLLPTPMEIPCPTSGCDLFQDFTIYGISLWWVGVACFAAMCVLCLRKAHGLALFGATAALLADAVLLGIMLATAACVACLGAAIFIGLLYLVLRHHTSPKLSMTPRKPSIIFFIWGGLFIAAGSMAGTEFLRPWDITGQSVANTLQERRIYFSPSCPACRDAVTVFAGRAVFIPIAERDGDYAAIAKMHEELERGKTIVEALRASDYAQEEPFSVASLVLRWRLLRNKSELLKLGFDRLPLIMINGMPESLRPGHSGGTTGRAPNPSALPPELSSLDSCGDTTPEPCETPS